MKKFIATVLTCCMIFGVSACGNNTDSSDAESSANGINGTLFEEEYYNYGTEALTIIDQYLDGEMEGETAAYKVATLYRKIEANDYSTYSYSYGIMILKDTLMFIESFLNLNSENNDVIEEYRDNVASLLNVPLRYRETAVKAFDITSKDFIDALNAHLEEVDSSLVLDNFKEVEEEEADYFAVSFYSTKHSSIEVKYEADDKTDKLIDLEIKIDANENRVKEKDIENLGVYAGISIALLDPDIDLNELWEALDFNRTSEENRKSIASIVGGDSREYSTDTTLYYISIIGNVLEFTAKVK